MKTLLEELVALETELHHPGIPTSQERLEQLLHPEFHEVGRSGIQYDRTTVVNYLSSLTTAPPVQPSGHAVKELAPGCVLLTYRSEQQTEDGGSQAALRASVWLRTDIGWRLYYHQGTPCDALSRQN